MGFLCAKKKAPYVNWNTDAKFKDGGLGILKATTKNLSLIEGLSWRLFTAYNSFWATTLLNKYGTTTQRFKLSFIWKNILRGGSICAKATAWVPGNGNAIDVWNFSWIPHTPPIRSLIQGL